MSSPSWTGLILISVSGLLVWTAISAFWRRTARSNGKYPSLLVVAIAGLAAYTLVCAAADIAPRNDSLWSTWNGARLLPSFCLANGIGLYLDPWTEPISGNIYGPVHALAYLPATLMPTPISAILFGIVWGISILLAPIAWTQSIVFKKPIAGLIAGAGIALFIQFSFLLAPLRYVVFSANADIIALALGATATASLLKWMATDARGPLLISVISASAAVWAKQSAVPILIALPVYLAVFHGWRRALAYTRTLFYAIMAMSILFLLTCDAGNLFFHMFWFPAQHHWSGSLFPGVEPRFSEGSFASRLWVLGQAFLQLTIYSLTPLFLLIASRVWLRRGANPKASSKKTAARLPSATALTLIIAGFMIPIALMSRAKAGGDINALAHPLFYLTWAAVTCLSEVLNRALAAENSWFEKGAHVRLIRRGTMAGIVGLIIFASMQTASAWKDYPDDQNRAFEYARAHPGEVYFPWIPLAHVMAEGRLRHFAYGMVEREFTHLKVSEEQFRDGTPTNMEQVLFAPTGPRFVISRYVPDHTRRTRVADLPGWIVLEREKSPPGSTPPGNRKN